MTTAGFANHAGFFACLALLSGLTVWAMTKIGVLDVPGARSSHAHPTPKGGGVGIVLAFIVGTLLLYRYAAFGRIADPYFRAVLLASGGIAVIAFLDDVFYWPASVKLASQVAAAAIAILGGLTLPFVRLPLAGTVELGWLGSLFALVWIVAATNAMNFIDGLNGLASGVVAVTCVFLILIGVRAEAWFLYFTALILLAGVTGFLPFNFPRARIFMGDVGSQFCGFVLAVLAIAAGRYGQGDISIAMVPMLLAGILFDVAFTLARRLVAGERLAQAHRSHLYQVANRSGMPATLVTLTHWAFSAWGGACCVAFTMAPPDWKLFWTGLVLPPQLCWLLLVQAKARRAGLADALSWRRRRG